MTRFETKIRRWLRPLGVAALSLLLTGTVLASDTPDPQTVGIPGDYQDDVGCPGDWQPDCPLTKLEYDGGDDVWQNVFTLPAGTWFFKAALNDGWDENYGVGAIRGGDNLQLDLAAATDIKFYYSHETHWVTTNQNSLIATAPGSYQDELGCPGDWQPDCLRSWLQDPDGDGTYTFTTSQLPAGSYEVKVAIDESWSENYGAGGAQNGANIAFDVAADCSPITFEYEHIGHLLTIGPATVTPQPNSVTIPGSFQDEVGCPGDWQPDCAATHLAFDTEDQLWQGIFSIPAGSYEYKVAIDDSWDINYGANATPGGANLGLDLGAATDVKFYYSDTTHWVADNVNHTIATLAGNFQDELGCSGDWQPWCLRSWLQDPDGDGIYTFSTAGLPAGNYEVKVAHNEGWDENYGLGGVPGGPNIPFTVPASCTELFFTYDPASHELTIGTEAGGPRGNLALASAHWVSDDLVAWGYGTVPGDAVFTLHGAQTAGLGLDNDLGVTGADTNITLVREPAGLPAELQDRFPHLAGLPVLRVDAGDLAQVPALLRGQLAVSVATAGGELLDATSVQIPGVLDDLYTYDGPLGIDLSGAPTLRVWAPTAQNVDLLLYTDSDPATPATRVAMSADPATGVWSATGDASWLGQFYLYEVTVYAPSTQAIEVNAVTDPYSVSLATNSRRSQVVDLDDPSLRPAGWDELEKPALRAAEDVSVYELHVRDFSWHDPAVPTTDRGTFRAFTHPGSYGMAHLSALAEAGLSHLHLLPSFDIATVTERRADQVEPDTALLETYAPDSDQQQAAITAIEDQDGFNWGYDPWHYTVPEGSYSTDPDGGQRILEFREMVQALSEVGLRTVMDVVYNHTNAAGQNGKSVLDRIVPGYYHRLSLDGAIEQSSCCPNTATEHAMMEKLMVDSLVTWAKHYKVDGFRFDLMGHHSKANLLAVRQALDALTLEDGGVDGGSVYLYGEGWNFGEVANNARFEQATQANMAGTGVGSFNDRIRDGARGGGPFSGLQEQGFLTGLAYDPNATDQGSIADQEATLAHRSDWIRVSLAGNLKDFPLIDRNGNPVLGWQVDYNGQQAGYTLDPQEIINYVAAHDNETLFDAIQLKVPQGTSVADRVRVQNLGADLVILGQGIPFLHAGMDMLRSKSLDRDSFNSGDWFNRLDFTYQTNNWGGGLPVASKNQDNWPLFAPLLADPTIAPASADIETNATHVREMLAIRKSSRLFRLGDAQQVIDRLGFHNTGPGQVPGLIVMSLSDADGAIDRGRTLLMVLFNANDAAQSFALPELAGLEMVLHPVQAESADPWLAGATYDSATGTFDVPARTTVVFEAKRPAIDQIDLLLADIDRLEDEGRLEHRYAFFLRLKLGIARFLVDHGHEPAAIRILEGVERWIGHFVAHNALDPDDAAALSEAVDLLIGCLDG